MRFIVSLISIAVVAGASAGPTLAADTTEPFRPRGVTASDGPAVAARAAIAQRPGLFGDAGSADLVVTSRQPTLGGVTVVRLEQRVDGVPVLGGEAVVALDEDNHVVAASGEALEAGPRFDTHARLSASASRSIALRDLAREHGSGLVAGTPELVIFDPALFDGPGLPGGTLVWDLLVERFPDVARRVLVDADSGEIVLDIEAHRTAGDRYVCDGGGVYATTNARIPCTEATAARREGDGPTGDAEIDTVYDDLGTTYDFFAALDRDSIDGAGLALRATVHACPIDDTPRYCPYANAYWSSSLAAMVFGDGFGSALDVTAHELTHGITDDESELFYWYQSGAINESLSDVFGEFVELSHAPGAAADRWLLGEDLPIGAIRDMADPNSFGDPAATDDPRYYTGTGDNGGVHYNSGVGNRAASLMVDGGTLNGQTVTGIGLTKATRIWYLAARLLRSGSDYADLAVALVDGCSTLVGTDAITSADCTQVGNAIVATRMAIPPAAAPVPQAPVCDSGLLSTSIFATSFEGSLSGSGWTPEGDLLWYATASNPSWRFAASGRDNAYGRSGTTSATDSSLKMTSARAIPADAYLRFSHAYGLASGDGGVVEYSTNGTTWQDVSSLGTTIDRGYTGVVAAGSALTGRSAFTGSSQGITSTRVPLGPLAGESVRFRFRLASATGESIRRWYVDDVAIYTCPSSTTTTETTATVARAGGPADGTVLMVPSGQEAGSEDVLCRYGDPSCAIASSAGSFVTLRAVPDPYSTFSGWEGACSGFDGPVCAVVADAPRSATAVFTYMRPAVTAFATLGNPTMVPEDFWMRATFNRDITGLALSDLSVVASGTASCQISRVVATTQSLHDIKLTDCSGVGDVRLRVAADTVADLAGSVGPVVDATSEPVTFVDPSPPSVTAFAPRGATTTTDPRPVFDLSFDENVSDLDPSELTVVNSAGAGCAVDGVTSTSAAEYEVAVRCGSVGTVHLELAANAVQDGVGSTGPTSAATSAAVTIVRSGPDPSSPSDAPAMDSGESAAAVPAAVPAESGSTRPVLRARDVRWARPTPRGIVSARFAAARGTTYRIRATRLAGRAAASGTRTGRCRVRADRTACTIRLAPGRWRVEIRPTAGGVLGKPVRRVLSIG